MNRLVRIVATLALAAVSPSLLAADPHPHGADAAPDGVEALSPPLREALVAEMQAIQGGMMSVVPALVAGRYEEVSATAERIRDSYIMKQSLSPAQLEELHTALPADFQALDARFHEYAGMLAHVAESEQPELVAFYYARMMETCVACHSSHATAKFPELATKDPAAGGHGH